MGAKDHNKFCARLGIVPPTRDICLSDEQMETFLEIIALNPHVDPPFGMAWTEKLRRQGYFTDYACRYHWILRRFQCDQDPLTDFPYEFVDQSERTNII